MKKNIFFVIMSCLISESCMAVSDYKNDLSLHNFYNAVYRQDAEWVENHLKEGYNPNKCIGDAGWYDSHPLKVLTGQFMGEYKLVNVNGVYKHADIEFPGLDVFNLLVKYNVNVNELPYVWQRVYLFDGNRLDRWWGYEVQKTQLNEEDKLSRNESDMEVINDANMLIEALLKAGADPDMKGHPFPFGYSRRLLFFSDKKAFKYFNSKEATTPLYEAIKKGSLWESQVDLLLKYGATLDESCLEAAKLSGDEKMIEKINNLYKNKK